jgi:hypothetical protein
MAAKKKKTDGKSPRRKIASVHRLPIAHRDPAMQVAEHFGTIPGKTKWAIVVSLDEDGHVHHTMAVSDAISQADVSLMLGEVAILQHLLLMHATGEDLAEMLSDMRDGPAP